MPAPQDRPVRRQNVWGEDWGLTAKAAVRAATGGRMGAARAAASVGGRMAVRRALSSWGAVKGFLEGLSPEQKTRLARAVMWAFRTGGKTVAMFGVSLSVSVRLIDWALDWGVKIMAAGAAVGLAAGAAAIVVGAALVVQIIQEDETDGGGRIASG